MAELKYKTFDQLMASVEGSLSLYADNGLIKRQKYIKTAKKINKDLGPKINGKREVILQVEDFRAELPLDLKTVLCAVSTKIDTLGNIHPSIHGTRLVTNTKEELLKKGLCTPSCEAYISCKNKCVWITKKTETTEIQYHTFFKLKPSHGSLQKFHSNSPNRQWDEQKYQISIEDAEIHVNFESGEIYLSYITDMVDQDGNLLVLDHDLVNPYYESAIKSEILYDLWMRGEETRDKYKEEFEVHLPAKREEARSIITDPGYRKLNEWNQNMLRKYFNEFYTI